MTNQEEVPTLQLGPDGPQIQPMGIGTRFWGYGDEEADLDRRAAFDTALNANVTLFANGHRDFDEIIQVKGSNDCTFEGLENA